MVEISTYACLSYRDYKKKKKKIVKKRRQKINIVKYFLTSKKQLQEKVSFIRSPFDKRAFKWGDLNARLEHCKYTNLISDPTKVK